MDWGHPVRTWSSQVAVFTKKKYTTNMLKLSPFTHIYSDLLIKSPGGLDFPYPRFLFEQPKYGSRFHPLKLMLFPKKGFPLAPFLVFAPVRRTGHAHAGRDERSLAFPRTEKVQEIGIQIH